MVSQVIQGLKYQVESWVSRKAIGSYSCCNFVPPCFRVSVKVVVVAHSDLQNTEIQGKTGTRKQGGKELQYEQ